MRTKTRFLASLAVPAALLLAAAPAAAVTKVLTVHPHQLRGYATTPSQAFTLTPNGIASTNQPEFLYPVKLPVGATVTRLKVWVNSPDGGGFVRLIRVKDGVAYASPAGDLAGMTLNGGTWFQWDQLVDATIGPAPGLVAADHRYYLYVKVISEEIGTMQITYTVP